MKKLIVKINNKTLEVASKDIKSKWYDAPAKIKKKFGKGWRLPTKEELNAMYNQLYKKGFGGFTNSGFYWSSSETDNNYAWYQYMVVDLQHYHLKDYIRYVRAVRDLNTSTESNQQIIDLLRQTIERLDKVEQLIKSNPPKNRVLTKNEIIKGLKEHNDWRRGAEIEMINPKRLGKIIDGAINFLEQ